MVEGTRDWPGRKRALFSRAQNTVEQTSYKYILRVASIFSPLLKFSIEV